MEREEEFSKELWEMGKKYSAGIPLFGEER
jgi:hypothetical protein